MDGVFNLTVEPLDISFFTEALSRNLPVSLSRWGDGEALCVLHAQGANCDGSRYDVPGLSDALAMTLIQPGDYLHGIAPKIINRKNGIKEAMFAWLEKYSKVERWYDTEVFLTASLAGQLRPFIDELKKRKVMIIGPKHLKRLSALGLPVTAFVEVPPHNAWLDRERIKRDIQREVYQCDVLLFSAGMAAKVFIYDLFVPLGKTRWLLDLGSVWDGYVGVDSRSYSRKLTPEQKAVLLWQNFGMDNVGKS